MKNSPFRHWLNEKWYEHKEEVLLFGGEPFANVTLYFQKYKWWLKSIYRSEQKKEDRKRHG